ncbi:MAG: DUF1059 domain-containing protein [Thermoleophilaceae bacterium]|nr:DUF1059 domain-containing protein [Thermoleophilaceae bacterium]
MRVIDLECGHTLTAATDEELFEAVRIHLDGVHSDAELSDDLIRGQIEKQAYEATDS